MLYSYLQQVQRLLGFDLRQQDFSLDDLIVFVNSARRQVAAQGQCCRWLTPAGGPIEAITVVHPGSGYTAPTVHITPPDAPSGQPPYPRGAQATANVIAVGGGIASVSMMFGGEGYFAPQVRIVAPTGQGAVLSANVVASVNRTSVGQEIYNFEDIDLGPNAGAYSILSVRNITLLWSTLQYTLQPMSFSRYMREYRRFSVGYLGQPAVWCQFGQGTQGSIRIYPVPDQPYAMQWDCLIVPQDLSDDDSYEAIPDPWRDAVPIYAAYLAMLGRSYSRPSLTPLVDKFYNPKDGGLFGDMMRRARAFAQPGQTRMMGF